MIPVRVADVSDVADSVKLYDLHPTSGDLPAFTAGSHIDLHLPNGLMRSYSLVNPESERRRYQVAVALDRASRGGSSFMHESIRPGTLLEISEPRNNFFLVEDAAHSILIAGGIGVTPMMPMIQRLEALGRSWKLHYCGRTRSSLAFREHLTSYADRVDLRLDDESAGELLDIAALMRDASPDTHFYCCGPAGMLGAFQSAAAATLEPSHTHLEFFAPREAPATDSEYTVELARSHKTVTVRRGCTILETLMEIGIEVDHNCTQGICGTCETRVLSGVPDHRDEVLTESERASNKTMMICCSGSKTRTLVLDL